MWYPGNFFFFFDKADVADTGPPAVHFNIPDGGKSHPLVMLKIQVNQQTALACQSQVRVSCERQKVKLEVLQCCD